MTTKPMGVRLSEDMIKRLKVIGAKKDRSPHYLVKEAVEEFVHKEEFAQRELAIVRERVEHYERTGEHYTHEEMKAWAKQLTSDYKARNP